MILLMFLLGIALIFGISRYNESNKLFWVLTTAFVLGFTGSTIYSSMTSKKQSKVELKQAQPTQGLAVTPGSLMYLVASDSLTTPVKETSSPVSQAFVPATIERNITLSKVFGVTRGLYLHVLPNPPNSTIMYDTS